MAKTTECILIKDRVRITSVGSLELQVLPCKDGPWRMVGVDDTQETFAAWKESILSAIRDACEDVRKRCLEAAVATIRSAAGDTLEQTADEVDAAIRELML